MIKYAFNDNELTKSAIKTQEILSKNGVHFSLIQNSQMLANDGALVALKMGYIELYAANAIEFQYVIKSVWVKLEAAKKGDLSQIRDELKEFGFELISIKFLDKKTLLVLANSRAVSKLDQKIVELIRQNI